MIESAWMFLRAAKAPALLTALAVVAGGAQAVVVNGTYKLENQCSGKVAEVAGGSTEQRARAVLWSWEGDDAQKWRIESIGGGLYRFVAVHSGQVLDAAYSEVEAGRGVFQQKAWTGKGNQRFQITDLGSGWMRITSSHNGQVLEVRSASTADGATLWQQTVNTSCAQRWKLVPLDGAGTPVAAQVHAGNNQTGTVGSTLPVRPALVVRDTAGRPVPSVPVTFRVVTGGGSIAAPTTSTDANGIATAGSWTLGPTVGSQTVVGSSPGLPEVVFTANATAAAGTGVLEMAAGSNNQTATVGTNVPVAPAVVVRAPSTGNPVPGVTVTFTPASGSGSVGSVTAVSDASGRASAGRWTLGTATGTQTVTARATGYSTVTFSATALAATAPTLNRSVFMSGVYEVWDMAFTPDGAMLFSERGRGLKVRLANGTVRTLFLPTDFVSDDQSGMLGIAVDPAFASNRRIYVYMSSSLSGVRNNRVIRLVVNTDYSGVTGRTDIVANISYQRGSEFGGRHSGGDLDFGPDGFLYVTTGDTRTGTVPQNLRELGGKVLRVDTNGAAAAGNNAPAGADARIYAWGFRNPQGVAFRPGGGTYLIEQGPGQNDEATRLRAAGNGGWDPRPRPLGSSTASCPNGTRLEYCGYEGAQMTDTALFPDAMRPVWASGKPALGTAGGDFVSGAAWRSWNGALVVAQLAGRRLLVVQLDAAGTAVVSQTPLFATLNTRLRTAVFGPDGALYVATGSDNNRSDVATQIWRVAPQ